MTAEGQTGSGTAAATQTRGFLFADIRGYTEYIERHGAAAAADLLARYRAIVRNAIAQHDGAEIRTEGDSFYVVLLSASSAVLCALSILKDVEAENTRQPEHAIRVGIGVHAGEAIPTAEGLVGSAVIIAARLSALARPGEVLVSETVRALTRSVISVAYVARGTHRLKGVAEPQDVFAAVPAGASVVSVKSGGLRRPLVAVLGVLGLALVVALVYISLPAGTAPRANSTPTVLAIAPTVSPAPTPVATLATPALTASNSLSPVPSPTGPTVIYIDPESNPYSGALPLLAPGTYRWDPFRPILAFQIDPGWSDRAWYALTAASDFTVLMLLGARLDPSWNPYGPTKPGLMLVSFARIQTVVGDTCNPGDTASYQLLGGRPRDLIDWLSRQRFLATSNLQPVGLAGWSGLSVDVTVKGDPGVACAGLQVPHAGSVSVFSTTESSQTNCPCYSPLYKLYDGEEAQFTALDIGGDSPLVLIATSLIPDFANRLPWAQDLYDTITALNQ